MTISLAIEISKILYIDNIETVIDSQGSQKGSPEHDPADSLVRSGPRARLRLEQRLLKCKDGSGPGEV
jgi:hypothetical protein